MPRPLVKRLLCISLRTMLVMVTVLCVTLAWKVRTAERQKEAVAWVNREIGMVHYDFAMDERGLPVHDADFPAPAWLVDVFGLDYFARVVRVDRYFHDSVDEHVADLSPLHNLPRLQWLDISHSDVTDLRPLTELSQLRVLRLSDTPVSDLSPLSALSALKELDLRNTPVTDLSPIEGMTLEVLWLEDTPVADLSPLSTSTDLKMLRLCGTRVTDLSPLARISSLETLLIQHTEVSDLSALRGMTGLRKLCISGYRISEEEVAKLQTAGPNCTIGWLKGL